jgi:hypothetical protein
MNNLKTVLFVQLLLNHQAIDSIYQLDTSSNDNI